jgi:hypothetical protein
VHRPVASERLDYEAEMVVEVTGEIIRRRNHHQNKDG